MLDLYADRYNDPEHFKHVLDYLFTPALEAAGYETVPPTAAGSDLIHAEIISNLETCELVLCDISTSNPNVFFELGIRTSLDRPVALVRDNFTLQIPFDTGSVNTHKYDASLQPWKLPTEIKNLTLHIQEATARSGNRNTLWRYFGLTRRAAPAEISDPTQAKLDLLIDEVTRLAKRSDTISNSPFSDSDFSETNGHQYGHQYERQMTIVLTSMGYLVREAYADRGFDLIIEDACGRMIYGEVMRYSRSVTKQEIGSLLERAVATTFPILLITYTQLSTAAREAVSGSKFIKVAQWRDENDNDRLAETLRHMFASILDSPRSAMDDQPQ